MNMKKVIQVGGPLLILGIVLSETVAHILAFYILKWIQERQGYNAEGR